MDTTTPARADALPPQRTRAKAIVAIAAGAALLLGGGGTLASWSTSQALNIGTINSGDLNLTTAGAATWTLQGAAQTTPTTITDPSTVKIVPGDVLVMTRDVTLTVKGDTMSAKLDVAQATIPTGLQASVQATGVTPGNITPADDGKTVTVTVTITFPASTAERNLVNTAFDLGDVTLTLSQLGA